MMPPSYWLPVILHVEIDAEESKHDAELLKIIEEIQRDASNDALLKVERSIVDLLNFK